MNLVSIIIDFTNFLGSLLCFQEDYATFEIGGHWLPVCSGCLGIYLGVLLGASVLPRLETFSKKIYSIQWASLFTIPMIIYFIILNIERALNMWLIPGVKVIYFSFGILFGFEIFNFGYQLAQELEVTLFHKALRFYPIVWLALIASFILALPFYSTDVSIVFTLSLLFLVGLVTLLAAIIAFTTKLLLKITTHKNFNTVIASSLFKVTVFTFSFSALQYLFIHDSALTILGFVLTFLSLGFLAWMVNDLSLKEMGLVTNNWRKNLVKGILWAIILYSLFVVYYVVFRHYNLSEMLVRGNWHWMPVIIVVVISEELLFRGILFPTLEKGLDTHLSVFLCSLFFALSHQATFFQVVLNWKLKVLPAITEFSLINFSGSIILNYLFVRSRSLVAPATTHSLWDLLVYTGNIYTIPF